MLKGFTTKIILTSTLLALAFFSTANTFNSKASSFQPSSSFTTEISNNGETIPNELVACGTSPSFSGVANLGTPNMNKDIASGDFDNDGLTDLVSVSEEGNAYYVTIKSLDGSYPAPTTYSLPTGSTPTSVAVADFNLDGKKDLVITRGGSNSAQIFTGDGDGSFTAGNVISVGSGVQHVTVADFNSDGRPDFATINTQTFTVAINNATSPGTFTSSNVSTGGNSFYLLAGDFTSDGKVDILVSRSNINSVRLYPGNGNGAFGTATSISVGNQPWGSVAGDFNKDGNLDAAVVNEFSDSVSILLGTGSGLSSSPMRFSTVDDPVDITVGDFNNDSNLDLAIVGYDSNTLQVRVGDGTGNFATSTNYTVGAQPFSVIVGKFNNDASLDIVTANHSGRNLSIVANNCCSPFVLQPAVIQNTSTGDYYTQPLMVEEGGKYTYLVTAGALPPGLQLSNDAAGALLSGIVNQSGTYNFTITASTPGCASSSRNYSLVVATPTKNFGFNYGNSIPVSSSPSNTVAADLNSDGLLDLAVVNYAGNKVTTFAGDGKGKLTLDETATTGAGPNGLASGDFNEDGVTDLVTANVIGKNISVLICKYPDYIVGDGPYPFYYAPAVNYSVANAAQAVAVGDFNQDGHQDLAVAVDGQSSIFTNQYASVTIFNGRGDGTFTNGPRIEITLAVTKMKSLAVGDFNKDGKHDIATANFNNNNVTICLATGPNSFSKSLVGVGTGPVAVRIGDFNKDGKQDIVTANSTSANISVALGNGNGTFATPTTISLVDNSPLSVELMEINNDGNVDLLVTLPSSGLVVMLIGEGNGSFALFSYPMLPPAVGVCATTIGDFDGDNIGDVAIPTGSGNNIELVFSKF